MKVTITVADTEDVGLIVLNRNTRSGADSNPFTIDPGKSAEVEVTDIHQLAAYPAGPSNPSDGVNIASPSLVEDKKASRKAAEVDTNLRKVDPDLREGTDEEVTEVIKTVRSNPAQLTQGGEVELVALNKALAEKGLQPVDGKRRSTLQKAIPAE